MLDGRHIEQDLFYVIFWPETETWDDNALSSVSRNRVTFMRYNYRSYIRKCTLKSNLQVPYEAL